MQLSYPILRVIFTFAFVTVLAACGGGNNSNGGGAKTGVNYSIGGNLSGLAGGAQVTIQNNGGDTLALNANGSFTFHNPVS